MAENINLGDKITLSGFSGEEGSTMIVVKKMVGNYVKRIMDELNHDFQGVGVSLKKIHQHPDGKGGKNEIHIKVNAGRVFTSEVIDFNLFVAIDKAFKKAIAEI